MQLAHRSDTLPLTRRYMLDAVGERGVRAMEPEPGNAP